MSLARATGHRGSIPERSRGHSWTVGKPILMETGNTGWQNKLNHGAIWPREKFDGIFSHLDTTQELRTDGQHRQTSRQLELELRSNKKLS